MSTISPDKQFKYIIICIALVSIFSIALYIYPSTLLTGEWILDDKVSLLHNPLVVSTQEHGPRYPLSSLWIYDFWGNDRLDSSESHKSWRPLCTLSYRWNYDWIKDPQGHLGFATLDGAVMSRKSSDFSNEATLLSYYFHLVDRVFHGIVSGLCILVAWYTMLHHNKLGDWSWKWHAAPLVGILFAVHPIHVESVANTTGRAEVLCALFYMLGFITYARFAVGIPVISKPHHWSKEIHLFTSTIGVIFTGFFTLCSMLCKEHGITLPVTCLIWDVLIGTDTSLAELRRLCTFSHKNIQSSLTIARRSRCIMFLIRVIIMLIVTIYMAFWRLAKNGSTSAPDLVCEQNPGACDPYSINRFLHYSFLWCFNFWLLLFPKRLAPDWTGPSIEIVNVWNFEWKKLIIERLIPSLMMWCFMLLFIFSALYEAIGQNFIFRTHLNQNRKYKVKIRSKPQFIMYNTRHSVIGKTWRRTILMSITWMLLPFLLTSNLFVYIGLTIADRTLYLPSFGYCLLLVQVLVGLCKISFSTFKQWIFCVNKYGPWKDFLSTSSPPSVFSTVFIYICPIVAFYISKTRSQTELWTEGVTIWGECYRVNPLSIMGEREYGLALVNNNRPKDAAIVLKRNHDRALVSPWGDQTVLDAKLRRQGLTRPKFEANIRRWKRNSDLLQSRFIFTTAMTNAGDCKKAEFILQEGINFADNSLTEIFKEEHKVFHTVESRQMLLTVKQGMMRERAALYVVYSKCAIDLAIMNERTMLAYKSAPGHPQVLEHFSQVQKLMSTAERLKIHPSQVKLGWKKVSTGQVADFVIDPQPHSTIREDFPLTDSVNSNSNNIGSIRTIQSIVKSQQKPNVSWRVDE